MKSLDGFIKKTFFMGTVFFFLFNFLSLLQEETENNEKKKRVCSQDALTRLHKQADFPDWDFNVCLMADSLRSILLPLQQPFIAQWCLLWDRDTKGLVQLLGSTGTNSQAPAQRRQVCLGVKEWSIA